MFNRNTVKLSYSCLPIMKNFINSHNQQILNKENSTPKDCNCQSHNNCSFNGKCLLKGIYKATVWWNKGNKEYVGSIGVYSMIRYNQHKYSMNNDKGQQTTLSKFYKLK